MPEISLGDVRFAYPGGVEVFPEPGLSLELAAGATALVGENGAGKTTLTKLLNGLLRPASGSVRVADVDVRTATVARMAAIVGYAFQNPDDQLFERTLRAEVGFGLRAIGRTPSHRRFSFGLEAPASGGPGTTEEMDPAVRRALELCGLLAQADVHPHDLGLSERKWVAIASALVVDPPVIVLDEPTLGQDFHSRQRLAKLVSTLAEEGKLVLVVTHDMDFVAEVCPTTVVLTHGHVRYLGPTPEAFLDSRLVEEAGLEPPHPSRLARAVGLPATAVNEETFLAAWEQARSRPAVS